MVHQNYIFLLDYHHHCYLLIHMVADWNIIVDDLYNFALCNDVVVEIIEDDFGHNDFGIDIGVVEADIEVEVEF